jgi:hypothetical protein
MPEKKWHTDAIVPAGFDPVAKGAILRIADALELMAKDKGLLVKENLALVNTNVLLQGEIKRIQEREKKTEAYWRNAQAYGEKMARSRNGLRGYVGKLQKKLAGK